MAIGDRLRKIRTDLGMTAKSLSELSGVPEKTIYRIETGEVQDPKLSSLEPLIKTMGCSADELIFNEPETLLSRRARRAFEEVEKLSPLKRAEILNVVMAYCKMNQIETYAFDKSNHISYSNEKEENYAAYMEEIREYEYRESELTSTKALVKAEEEHLIEMKNRLGLDESR